MGTVNVIPFWPVKCACADFVKKLEFHKLLTCFKYSAKIVVFDVVYSIVVSRQDSPGRNGMESFVMEFKIMAFLISGMLLLVNILPPAKHLA